MNHCVTSTGFECDFDPQNANDMRVLQHVRALVDPDASPLLKMTALTDLPVMLIGQDQTDSLYKHIGAIHGGRVPPAELEKELTEIMTAVSAGKK